VDPADEKLSRFLAFALRHRPDRLGIELDAGGWVSVAVLCVALERVWSRGAVDRERLARIVAQDPKGRYELDAQRAEPRMRARYGHSVEVSQDETLAVPPEVLLHGTARRFEAAIRDRGLRAMDRRFVHLTDDVELAIEVGKRRDAEPLVLRIEAAAMHRDGHAFHSAGRALWLVREVPPEYLARAR
jgi:putative RNA 2'-phosphotransferase